MFNTALIRMFLLRHTKLVAIVAAAAGLLCLFLTLLFPNMPADEAGVVSASWPPIVRDLFGDPLLGFSDIHAWLHLQIFNITFWAIYGVLATILAAGIIAREIECKTMDILLSCPIRRRDVLTSELAAILILLVLAVLLALAGCAAGLAAMGGEIRLGTLVMVGAEGVFLSFSLASATLLISVFVPNQVLSAALAVAAYGLMFFVDSVLVRLVSALEPCAFLNPFHFYNPEAALIRQAARPGDLIALFAFGATGAVVAALVFARRDIRS